MTGRTSKPPRPVGDTPLTPDELAYVRAHKRARFKCGPRQGARGGTNRKEPAGLALPALPALDPSVWDDIPFKQGPYDHGKLEWDGKRWVAVPLPKV